MRIRVTDTDGNVRIVNAEAPLGTGTPPDVFEREAALFLRRVHRYALLAFFGSLLFGLVLLGALVRAVVLFVR